MKIYFVNIIFILIICGSITGQVPDTVKFKSLSTNDFQKAYLMEEKAVLIDVREFFEFRKTRLKDAINIPSSGNLGFAADTLERERYLFLYCTSGYRSKKVAKYFYDKGFSKVYSLDGGIAAWKKDGMAVERKRLPRRGVYPT